MMIRMLKTYTISVTIQEGCDEFWEGLDGKSGCDEVVQLVKDALEDHGFAPERGCYVRLERFEERGPM
jgi:hypothetical protein